ncbi:hypothetical protein MMC07_007057 [Pseudocyphellaria aurata]|nr:hypothetical protein [Pseudocyphellaria aurata]
MPDRDLRLLSLDGGGVRGLSSLAILKRLLEIVNPVAPPKPCEYFDMIGGTSTGGLIAIMLGRLEMTIDECIDAYVDMFDRLFQKRRRRITINGHVQERFDTQELERSIREIIAEKDTVGENALLKGSENQKCKVFVCALSKETSDTVLFTSYPSRGSSHMYHNTRIWEAARATSAASSFFDPIKIGQFEEEFVDGAVGANNPVVQLWNEAKFMSSGEALEANIKCLVSIGTGVPSLDSYGSSLLEIAKTLKDIATETEKTAESFHRAHSDLDEENRYFRFNVSQGLESIGLEDAAQKNKIMAATSRYVALESVMNQMKRCGKSLSTREYSGPFKVQFSLKGLPRVPKFVARDQEMNDLEENLLPQPTRETYQKVFVLHGLGGSGKTQLAIEFARRSQKIFSSIFWLNGNSRESVRQSFAQIARQLPEDQIPVSFRKLSKTPNEELDEIISNIQIWFNKLENNRWLLIFDNVDRDNSPEVNDSQSYDVEDFFPEVDHGSILITSRLRQLRQLGQDRQLGSMSYSEGVEALKCRIGRPIEGMKKTKQQSQSNSPLNMIQALKGSSRKWVVSPLHLLMQVPLFTERLQV